MTAKHTAPTMREALGAMLARFELYLGPSEIFAGHHDKALVEYARAALSQAEPEPSATDELAALRAKATKGPWEVDGVIIVNGKKERAGIYRADPEADLSPGDAELCRMASGDARFIVALVNAYDSGKLTAAPGDGWRPIEEAPKQDAVLLFAPAKNISGDPDQLPVYKVARAADFCWATRWQPLPAPPAKPEGK